jgi:PilZ domain
MQEKSLESATEKREATRYSVLRQGKILLEDRTIYCAIHDLSTTGARLHVGDAKVPDWFELIIMGEQQRLFAEVKWAHGEFRGVTFSIPLSPAAVSAARATPRIRSRGK